jgi:hypothetical protein
MPASNWKRLGTAANPKGFKYSDPNRQLGPISSASITADKLMISGGGPAWPYSLSDPPQGRIALRFELGSMLAWCASVPAKASGNPPLTLNHDKLDLFTGAANTAPPGNCPPIP